MSGEGARSGVKRPGPRSRCSASRPSHPNLDLDGLWVFYPPFPYQEGDLLLTICVVTKRNEKGGLLESEGHGPARNNNPKREEVAYVCWRRDLFVRSQTPKDSKARKSSTRGPCRGFFFSAATYLFSRIANVWPCCGLRGSFLR